MRNVFALSLFLLSVTGEPWKMESFSSDEEMDDTMIPYYDPIWWFIRSPSEEFWLSQQETDFPPINIFGEEVPNFLQFILLGRVDDIVLVLVGCPERLLMELLEIRERIMERGLIRHSNNLRQNLRSARFSLNHLFGNRRFADERPLEVCDLSRLFSNDQI